MLNLIKKYNLAPHPEGGFFKETYRSKHFVNSFVNDKPRNAITHIYFLLLKGQVSRFHKVIHDEIWNYYEGSPLRLIQLADDVKETVIGPESDNYHCIIESNTYQAAESTGDYSLVGCSVAPGFDFKDFSFIDKESFAHKKVYDKYPEYLKFL